MQVWRSCGVRAGKSLTRLGMLLVDGSTSGARLVMLRPSTWALSAKMVLIALVAFPALGAAAPGDAGWSSEFGADELYGTIVDAAPFRDGLAVCGSFIIPGGSAYQGVAWWDGVRWHALAPRQAEFWPDSRLLALGDSLVWFWHTETRSHNSRWNGSDWRDFGDPIYGAPEALVTYGADIVVGGSHMLINGQPESLARWDGANWHALPGAPAFPVTMLIASGDTLVAANPDSMVMWDGLSWHRMDSGRGPNCQALCWHNGQVVAGGIYGDHWIAAWDGSTWQPLPSLDYYDRITSLVSCNGHLYNCTEYSGRYVIGGVENRFEVLEGDSWRVLTYQAPKLHTWGNRLLVFGSFPVPGRIVSKSLSVFDGRTWYGLAGPGGMVHGQVNAIADMGGMPVIGGAFEAAGSVTCRLAGWCGGDWISLTPSGSGTINELIAFDGHAIALGGNICGLHHYNCLWRITDYVTSSSNNFAKSAVCAVEHAGRLYVGAEAGSDLNVMSANDDCPPLHGTIASALASWSGKLFAGGTFSDVDSLPVCCIASLDINQWRQTGEGLDARVLALEPFGDRLIAGGRFRRSGQTVVNHVAAWDGAAWKALGAGFDDEVRALAVMNGRLYAGGSFTASGDVPLAHVAYWDGAGWRPLGTGVAGPVNALTPIGTSLWLGGNFPKAGGILSKNVARWDDSLVPDYLSGFEARREGTYALATWRISETGDPVLFQVWREVPGQPRTPIGNSRTADRLSFAVADPAPPVEAVSYWLQQTTDDGWVTWYGPANVQAAPIPAALSLSQNRPNPFNPRTTIRFGLPQPGRVNLSIFDLRGARVAVLVDADLQAGERSVQWDGQDAHGALSASGTYIVRLVTEQGVRTSKLTLAK